MLLLLSCSDSFVDNHTDKNTDTILLDGWQFYINDSSNDSNTFPITDSIYWIPLKSLHTLPQDLTCKTIWLRTILPEWNGSSPGLYIGQIDYFMYVYLNRNSIYKLGDSSSSYDDIIGWNQNLIQLPYYKSGDTLTFSIGYKEGSNNFEVVLSLPRFTAL